LILSIAALSIAFYAALIGLARTGYRAVLYPAPGVDDFVPPPGGELVRLTARDGVAVRALYLPPPDGARVVVSFHGNGETIGSYVDRARALSRRGLGVMLVEYRGYGVSAASGAPTEAGLYLDADAALDELARRGVDSDRVVAWGTSLGTGVAADVASRGRAGRLVLLTPYTSIVRMAARVAPFLPVGAIVEDRFDTLAKAPRIRAPALVVHGDRDEVVPYAMGRDVAAALPAARLVTIPGGHHNDLFATDPRLLDLIADHALGR
jgi:hypothetical protein